MADSNDPKDAPQHTAPDTAPNATPDTPLTPKKGGFGAFAQQYRDRWVEGHPGAARPPAGGAGAPAPTTPQPTGPTPDAPADASGTP